MRRNAFIHFCAILTVATACGQGALTPLFYFNGTNGATPMGPLVEGPDHNFYGTTYVGGTNGGYGTIFRVSSSGVLSSLRSFANTNGANPQAGLCRGADGNFYGATVGGGTNGGYGTLFRVGTNANFASLISFANTNGASPRGSLTVGPEGDLYGTTGSGGTNGGYGTVFKITTNGVFTSLVSFNRTNGATPDPALTPAPGGVFYGTTYSGGTNGGYGTVFRVTTNGILTSLWSFASTNGAYPYGGLLLAADGNLYGTTFQGGTNANRGTIFRLATNGALTMLVHFANDNGANPEAGLALGADGLLYGTTYAGGLTNLSFGNGYGTLFKITTNGVLTSLASFNNTNGAYPRADLVLGSDGNFYGTTSSGTNNFGSVFKFAPGNSSGPFLRYSSNRRTLVLSWDNPAWTLQSATNANGFFSGVTGAASPYTNFMPLPREFFRLTGN